MLAKEKKGNKTTIAIIAIVCVLCIGVFQIYMVFEKKSYKQSEELLSDSFSVLEVSMEDEEQTYYVNDTEVIFDQLVQGLESATFKPTKQTPKNPTYIIRIYNESLQVETTIAMFTNDQMQVNNQMYNVEEANLTLFEDAIFKEKYEVTFNDFEGFATYMYEQVTERGIFAEENQAWAETIALARIAQEKEVDLSDIDLLFIAPTKEVAEQLIAYDMTGTDELPYLLEAVNQERVEVAEVLLENNIGIESDTQLQQGPSPVIVAKMNEDNAMVDVLLRYGFEDEFVDPEHIEQAQKVVDFRNKDSDSVIEGLEKGSLPGIDFQIPTSSQEIIKVWGDYTGDEDHSILSYNRHAFWRITSLDKDRESDDIFAYMYQFSPNEMEEIVDMKEILGEPYDMFINDGVSELMYVFGDYSLSFIVDSDGYVWNMSYSYEEDREVYEK